MRGLTTKLLTTMPATRLLEVLMKTRMGLALVLLSSATASQGVPDARLSIIVYDAAHIGAKTLVSAEHLTGTILETAGILPSWSAGSLEDLGSQGIDFTAYGRKECGSEHALAILRIEILRQAPAGLAAQALGLSLPCARRGVQIIVYADRIVNVSETGGPTFARTLAYVMAHELGHVLLRSAAHASAGLMKGTWSKTDWQRAAASVVSFSPAEAQQITALHERLADTNVAQLDSLQAR